MRHIIEAASKRIILANNEDMWKKLKDSDLNDYYSRSKFEEIAEKLSKFNPCSILDLAVWAYGDDVGGNHKKVDKAVIKILDKVVNMEEFKPWVKKKGIKGKHLFDVLENSARLGSVIDFVIGSKPPKGSASKLWGMNGGFYEILHTLIWKAANE